MNIARHPRENYLLSHISESVEVGVITRYAMSRAVSSMITLLLLLNLSTAIAACQDKAKGESQSDSSAQSSQTERSSTNSLGTNYLKNLVADQKSFWTFPERIPRKDMKVFLPIAAISAGLFVSDADFSKQLSRSPSRIKTSNNVANFGLAAMVAGGGGMYLYGRLGGNEHSRETGVLASEAAIDSAIITEMLKLATQRQRPNEGSGQGHFLAGSASNSSFPSQHAAVAWSLATVFANEYPSPVMKLLSYGAASAISLSRITSLNHFPSDVFIGGTLGYFVGREAYRTHHDTDLPGASYGTFVKTLPGQRSPSLTGTTFVPMDSWVYPLFDRLAAMGYIDSAFEGQRPWTRQECARLVKEASVLLETRADSTSSASTAYKELSLEFAPELHGDINTDFDARLESTYAGVLGIGGPPLTDGFDYGETIVNNFGRPFGEGFNSTTGASTRFVIGPFGGYVRGEYQHGAPPMNLSPSVQQAILNYDVSAPLPAGSPWMVPPAATVDRFRFLEAYLSLNVKNNLVTFGEQSLWWGPDQMGPALFSTNAQPIPMFRLSRNVPYVIPFVSKLLGPLDIQAFLGQLNGYQYVSYFDKSGQFIAAGPPNQPHPWIHGEKFSFKPTPNFEFGFAETTVFGGPGFKFNAHTLFRSYSISNVLVAGVPNTPGDRRSALDFTYRIPGLRDWLSFYADSFTEDEFSPVAYPRRSAWWLGFYLPKIPRLNKLQFRAEGGYTDLPGLRASSGAGWFYSNYSWNSGYTNFGQIMGDWVGRQGRGVQATATYWLSARKKLEFTFRKQAANPALHGGGTLYDGRTAATFMLKPSLELSGYLQYERWNFPMLSSTPQSNVAVAVQLNFVPLGGMTATNLARAFKH
jgi:Capsule assembly protein Wzi/PAP2 superfamily